MGKNLIATEQRTRNVLMSIKDLNEESILSKAYKSQDKLSLLFQIKKFSSIY